MKKINFLMLFMVLLLVTFQNCGQVSVSDAPLLVEPLSIPKDKPEFLICPVEGPAISVPVTYVFIVDMSLSNLGGFVQESCGGSSYRYHLALSQASDHLLGPGNTSRAKRLEGISAFVSQVADTNPNLRFSVIGFSTQKLLGGAGVTCANSATSSKQTFLNRLGELKNVQTNDYRKSGAVCAFNSPFTMGTTSYLSAIDCLNENIDAEVLLSGASRPFYQIFFITDGKPNEKTSSGQLNIEGICGPNTSPVGQSCRAAIQACNNEDCIYDYITDNSYVPKLQMLTNSLKANGYGFNLKPIFYEKAGTPVAESDFPRASLSLNKLARSDGSQTTTTALTDLSSLATQLTEALGTQALVNYTFTSPMVINANAIPAGDKVLLDTDGDGLTDILEDSLVSLGYNKNNPRSSGILDSICHKYLADQNCSITSTPTCANTKVGFNLNQCDKAKLQTVLPGKVLTGYDSDNDGIVDYFEFLRGTNPFMTDYALDDDDDSVGNITELYRGSDPFSPQNMYRDHVTSLDVQEVVAPQSAQCVFSGVSLQLKINNISLVPEKDTNEVYITFVAEPSGELNAKRKLYSAKLIINSQGKFNKISLNNDDIVLVGEF